MAANPAKKRVKSSAGKSLKRATNASSAFAAAKALVFDILQARALVHSILRESHPTAVLTDETKLAALGFNVLALGGLATLIRQRGVPVDTAAVQQCKTILDVIKVVDAAA